MERRDIYRRGIGMVLLAVAVILFMSTASQNPHDPPMADAPVMDPPANVCGVVGAYLGFAMKLFFGIGSYLLCFVMAVLGGFLLLARPITDPLIRAVGGILFFISYCAGATLLFGEGGSLGGTGGMLGWLTASSLLRPIGTGGYVVVVLGMALGALLAADAWVLWFGRKSVEVLTMQGRAVGKVREQPEKAIREIDEEEPEEEPVEKAVEETKGSDKLADAKEALRKRIEEQRAAEEKVKADERVKEKEDKAREKAERAEAKIEIAKTIVNPEVAERAEAPTILIKEKPKDKPKPKKAVRQQIGDWKLPPLELLDPLDVRDPKAPEENVEEKRQILERTLEEFGIAAQVVEIDRGPVITQYELELAPGVKIGKIVGLQDDIARALKAISIRVVAPIPGKSTVGVEVPNAVREVVRPRALIESGVFQRKRLTIPLMLGKDASGEPLVGDLAQMPHMLIAGATGSGKSVCMNSIIMTMLLTQSPQDVKMILIDPKMVELSAFREVPHLMSPVVTDMKKAAAVLEWGCKKMDERYSLLANVGVRNIVGFNALGEKEIRKRLDAQPEDELEGVIFHMPYIVIIIDELADLMMVSAKEVENTITRLAQKSRAVGIHLIVATQRPSVDVVTGLIKANLPSRLAFQTASKIDSRTILDRNGADKLLGKGDMLFLPPGSAKLTRGQGVYTSDEEIKRVITFLVEQGKPEFEEELARPSGIDENEAASQDPLFNDAVRIILESQRGSVSLLQRKLAVGYSRASRLVDLMAEAGILGEYKGSQAREVNMTLEEWDAAHGGPGGPTVTIKKPAPTEYPEDGEEEKEEEPEEEK